MNRATKTTWRSLAVLLVGVSVAFAGGAGEQPSGQPPFGVAVQSDAPGTKLTGIGFIEAYNVTNVGGQRFADLRVLFRLRQGSRLDTVVSAVNLVIPNVNIDQAAAAQAAILQALRNDILQKFFNNDQSLQVAVKGLDDFVTEPTTNPFAGPQPTLVNLFDVVLAVR